MRKIILSFAACLALAAYGQKPVQDTRAMDTFIDQLMGKMTLDEKIGQLNLSGGGSRHLEWFGRSGRDDSSGLAGCYGRLGAGDVP